MRIWLGVIACESIVMSVTAVAGVWRLSPWCGAPFSALDLLASILIVLWELVRNLSRHILYVYPVSREKSHKSERFVRFTCRESEHVVPTTMGWDGWYPTTSYRYHNTNTAWGSTASSKEISPNCTPNHGYIYAMEHAIINHRMGCWGLRSVESGWIDSLLVDAAPLATTSLIPPRRLRWNGQFVERALKFGRFQA
jgi:hypothetical protein